MYVQAIGVLLDGLDFIGNRRCEADRDFVKDHWKARGYEDILGRQGKSSELYLLGISDEGPKGLFPHVA